MSNVKETTRRRSPPPKVRGSIAPAHALTPAARELIRETLLANLVAFVVDEYKKTVPANSEEAT